MDEPSIIKVIHLDGTAGARIVDSKSTNDNNPEAMLFVWHFLILDKQEDTIEKPFK